MHGDLPAGRARHAWIDVAKGAAILLVVLHHSYLALTRAGIGTQRWDVLDGALGTLRMPTFFLVSGLLALRSLSAPAPAFLRSKILGSLGVFASWSIVYVGVAAVAAPLEGRSVGDGVLSWLGETVTASNGLWYLVALPVFFGLARLTRQVPLAVVAVPAVLLSLVSGLKVVEIGWWGPDRMLQYFVFFLVGCRLGPWIGSVVPRARRRDALLLGAMLAVAGAALLAGGPATVLVGAGVLPFLALPFALVTAVLLQNARGADLVALLGRTTLPVYVLHGALVSLTVGAVARMLGPAHPPDRVSAWDSGLAWVAEWVLPVALAAVIALTTIGLATLLRPFPWLFGQGRARAADPPASAAHPASGADPRPESGADPTAAVAPAGDVDPTLRLPSHPRVGGVRALLQTVFPPTVPLPLVSPPTVVPAAVSPVAVVPAAVVTAAVVPAAVSPPTVVPAAVPPPTVPRPRDPRGVRPAPVQDALPTVPRPRRARSTVPAGPRPAPVQDALPTVPQPRPASMQAVPVLGSARGIPADGPVRTPGPGLAQRP